MITQELQKYMYRLDLIEQEFGVVALHNVLFENRNLAKFLGTDVDRFNLVLELKAGTLEESIEEDDPELNSLYEAFDTYFKDFSVEVGGHIALLDLSATSIGRLNEIVLDGFTSFKKVVGLSEQAIEFDDGNCYPPIDVIKQTSMWRQIMLFNSEDQATECLTYMALLAGNFGKWDFKITANEKRLNETIKLLERKRNNNVSRKT